MSSTHQHKRKSHNWQMTGCMFSVYQARGKVVFRSLVSPDFVELWYLINDEDFDKEIWEKLSTKEQRLMIRAYNLCRIETPAFNKQIAIEYKKVIERLDIIEGEVKAGNVNKSLVDEYNEIVDEMAKLRLIITNQALIFKKKMKQIYEQQVQFVNSEHS